MVFALVEEITVSDRMNQIAAAAFFPVAEEKLRPAVVCDNIYKNRMGKKGSRAKLRELLLISLPRAASCIMILFLINISL